MTSSGSAESAPTISSRWLPTAASSSFIDRKSTRLNSSHEWISYAVVSLKKEIAVAVRISVARNVHQMTAPAFAVMRPLQQPVDQLLVFFLHYPATPGIYTLSLHDALPI